MVVPKPLVPGRRPRQQARACRAQKTTLLLENRSTGWDTVSHANCQLDETIVQLPPSDGQYEWAANRPPLRVAAMSLISPGDARQDRETRDKKCLPPPTRHAPNE